MPYQRPENPTPEDFVLEALRRPHVPFDTAWLQDVDFRDILKYHTIGPLTHLLQATVDYQDKAMSYRNFNVSVGMFVLRGINTGKIMGHNAKFDDTDYVNIHAEDMALAKAKDYDFEKVSMVAVIGEPQPDKQSGKEMATLPPCGRCRNRMLANPLIDNDETLFCAATPDLKAVQLYSLHSLVAFHDSGDESGIASFEFPETPPDLGSGPQLNKDGHLDLLDVNMDETEWELSVGMFLSNRRHQLLLKRQRAESSGADA